MSDQSIPIAPKAQPFLLPGGAIGLLVIHGFGGTIGDYRQFADRLHQRGYTVAGVRLAGHGQGHEALRRTTSQDWQQSVEAAASLLREHCRQIVVLGASFGGALAFDYAARHTDNVVGLVSVNTPVSYRGGGWFQPLILRVLRVFTPYWPKMGLSRAERQHYAQRGSTTAWPIDGILETYRFLSTRVLPALPGITLPVLLLASSTQTLKLVLKKYCQRFRTI